MTWNDRAHLRGCVCQWGDAWKCARKKKLVGDKCPCSCHTPDLAKALMTPDPIYTYNCSGTRYRVTLKTGRYPNGRDALVLMSADDGSGVSKATVNIPEMEVPGGCVLIKTWSENESMLDFLVKNEIVEVGVGFAIPTGGHGAEAVIVRKGKNWPQ